MFAHISAVKRDSRLWRAFSACTVRPPTASTHSTRQWRSFTYSNNESFSHSQSRHWLWHWVLFHTCGWV